LPVGDSREKKEKPQRKHGEEKFGQAGEKPPNAKGERNEFILLKVNRRGEEPSHLW